MIIRIRIIAIDENEYSWWSNDTNNDDYYMK